MRVVYFCICSSELLYFSFLYLGLRVSDKLEEKDGNRSKMEMEESREG